MDSDEAAREGLREVARLPLRTDAHERALVLGAAGIPYWLFPIPDGGVAVWVRCADFDAAAAELARYAEESSARPRPALPLGKANPVSLFAYAWVLSVAFLLQARGPSVWTDAGASSSEAILARGEWWRSITALTLHGDTAHLFGNLGMGLLFAWLALPLMGAGLTWSLTVAGGAMGNLLNAWIYRGTGHATIGASTAVFALLGILVACQTVRNARHAERTRWWRVLAPLGAGLAFLAWLGVGNPEDPGYNTDYMAHLCGLLCGMVLGALAGAATTAPPETRLWHWLPLPALATAWWLALR